MKTLAQEIGALVMNLRAEEFETTEQFGERIGRVVLERVSPCPRCSDVHDRRLGCSEKQQFVVVCETAEPDSEVTACYGPFASRADALDFKGRRVFGEDIFPATYPLRRII